MKTRILKENTKEITCCFYNTNVSFKKILKMNRKLNRNNRYNGCGSVVFSGCAAHRRKEKPDPDYSAVLTTQEKPIQ